MPWASILLAGLTLICYFMVLSPLKKEHQVRKIIAEQELLQALGTQFRQGNLSNHFFEDAQRDFRIIGKPENLDIFGPGVVAAWRDMENLPLPMNILDKESPIRKLLMMLTPHEEGILLAGIICLLFIGYLFEHLYDRQVLLALFFLSGSMWMILQTHVPAAWWPPPIFSWSFTILTLTITTWLRAPKASLTITFRTWFIKVIQFNFNLPIVLIPLAYTIFLVTFNLKLSIYHTQFSLQTIAAPAAEALVFLLFLMGISYREVEDGGPEVALNRQFARAESLMEQDRKDDGMEILRKILTSQPSIAHTRRAGELAWQYHSNELAEQAFSVVLKDALASKDLIKIVKVIEEIAYKNLTVPGSALHAAMAAAMKKNMLGDVRGLLPFYTTHKEISEADTIKIYEDLVSKITAQSQPNKEFLFECQQWLETNVPDSESILKARTFFEMQQRASESFKAITSMRLIHKHLDVKILEVTNNFIALILQGQDKIQKVPWTAVEGLYGCHVTQGERGYRGSIFLKFKRKIFSCNFTRQSMMVKDRFGQSVGFEAVWESLKEHGPEDIPFLDLNDFPDVVNLSNYPRMAQEFIDQ